MHITIATAVLLLALCAGALAATCSAEVSMAVFQDPQHGATSGYDYVVLVKTSQPEVSSCKLDRIFIQRTNGSQNYLAAPGLTSVQDDVVFVYQYDKTRVRYTDPDGTTKTFLGVQMYGKYSDDGQSIPPPPIINYRVIGYTCSPCGLSVGINPTQPACNFETNVVARESAPDASSTYVIKTCVNYTNLGLCSGAVTVFYRTYESTYFGMVEKPMYIPPNWEFVSDNSTYQSSNPRRDRSWKMTFTAPVIPASHCYQETASGPRGTFKEWIQVSVACAGCAATTSPTTPAPATPAPNSEPSVTVVQHSGVNAWWFAVAVQGATTTVTSVSLKDSGSVTTFRPMTYQSWGYWTFQPSAALVAPLTVQVTTAGGQTSFIVNAIVPSGVVSPSSAGACSGGTCV